MESRLQSNEVRIPKPNFGSSVAAAAAAAATTITTSATSVNIGGNTCLSSSPPDFDFNSPCQYFKSSFARSLSLSCNQTKSLDFGINFGLPRTSPIREEPAQTPVITNGQVKAGFFGIFDDSVLPPPLPQSQPPPLSSIRSNNSHITAASSLSSMSSSTSTVASVPASSSSTSTSTASSNRNVWYNSHKQSSQRRSFDSAEVEVLRLRKECQNLVEENRRLIGLASGIVGGNLVVPGNSSNIEAVILQTQVDTLQWQLKQVEASRQMYRAVMEEVVRFLERCHRNLDAMQNGQIARSKSIHHVHHTDTTNDSSNPSSPRARSSTNLLDAQKSCLAKNHQEESTPSSPAATYNNFRDFTWRRSPKRNAPLSISNVDCDPDKLSQEAFRLLRTAQNLLNTQEPVLIQSKHALEMQYNINHPVTPPPSLQSHSNQLPHQQQQQSLQHHQQQQQQQQQHPPLLKPKPCEIDSDTFCMTFSRKMNMRESRLSLRSSTDDSVHSNSSSKNETDEETNHSPPLMKEVAACSTEDESGFSSISSFQEIGLPLSSTMISSAGTTVAHSNSSASDDSGECNMDSFLDKDSRNSTLKASQSPLLAKVGLHMPHNHRRWDSAPAVPPRTSLHTFSTLPGDDNTPRVLWV